MKWLVLLAVLVLVAGASSWPEGRPNCNVSGEWTDATATDFLAASVLDKGNATTILEVTFNSSGGQYNGTAPLVDPKTAALRVSGKDNDTLLLLLVCLNDVLWVQQTPLHESPRMMRMFAFRRRPPPPPPLQDTTTNPRSSVRGANSSGRLSSSPYPPQPSVPEFILVNISLPKREEDDNVLREDSEAGDESPGGF